MAAIYEPKGKAGEYSPLALNIYKGCGHACTYCYAPSATFTSPEVFTDPAKIRPRQRIIEQVEKEARKMQGDTRPILLSFTSDAYQPADVKFKLTRLALIELARNCLTATVLTKGGMRACRDFDILSENKNNAFAVSLTTDDPDESTKWEPKAALPSERVESLWHAKALGLKTWVSFEPVINPDAVIRLIGDTHEFVDLYKVGKLNYHPYAKTIDWHKFLIRVEAELDRFKAARYIKKDLEAYRWQNQDQGQRQP